MRYWCPECKSEYVVGEKPTPGYCTMLDDELDDEGEECGEILVKLPDFETPEQYEKRTGKVLSWEAAVWYQTEGATDWLLDNYGYASGRDDVEIILCVNSPEPPQKKLKNSP